MAAKSKPMKTILSSKAALTREERRAAGKALRSKLSRNSHADWQAPANRRGPIDLLIENSKGRLPQLLPIRYGRMMQSSFAFYRGAAAIMAADLAATPMSGIRVQACGDCHLMNFGGFATPERRIVFDINDFDETLPAPWEWDVKRLAASFVIAGRNNGFNKADAREGAARCVQSYREHMQTYAEMGVLDMWHERIDIEDLIALIQRKEWKKRVQKHITKASSRTVVEEIFQDWQVSRTAKPKLRITPLSFFISPVWKRQNMIEWSKQPFVAIEKLSLMIEKLWWIVTKSKMLRLRLLESEVSARAVQFF